LSLNRTPNPVWSQIRSAGIGVVVFASPDAAANAARGPRSYPRDDSRAWNVETVTVYEQLTSA